MIAEMLGLVCVWMPASLPKKIIPSFLASIPTFNYNKTSMQKKFLSQL